MVAVNCVAHELAMFMQTKICRKDPSLKKFPINWRLAIALRKLEEFDAVAGICSDSGQLLHFIETEDLIEEMGFDTDLPTREFFSRLKSILSILKEPWEALKSGFIEKYTSGLLKSFLISSAG